jgi:hypothetical protein
MRINEILTASGVNSSHRAELLTPFVLLRVLKASDCEKAILIFCVDAERSKRVNSPSQDCELTTHVTP